MGEEKLTDEQLKALAGGDPVEYATLEDAVAGRPTSSPPEPESEPDADEPDQEP